MAEKSLQIIPRKSDNDKHLYAFSCFNITKKDIGLGLRHIKAKVRHEFKQLARYCHPDTYEQYRNNQGKNQIIKKLLKTSIVSQREIAKIVDTTQATVCRINTRNTKVVKAYKFKELVRMRNRILNFKTMPITMDNLETVLDIRKGYKSTHDIILPWD